VIEFESVSFSYLSPSARKRSNNTAQAAQVRADWGNAPENTMALDNISFTLEDGEFLGIVGHTGSGKSTLIQLANGLLKPTSGRVLVDGVDISDKKSAAHARRNVGVVFQYPEHQLFAATVREDVSFGPGNLGMTPQEIDESVRKALAQVHLDYDEIAEKNPFALSGGQQRRVAFAGVLAMNPTTLVLDEPVAGLDPHAKADFLALIRELHEESGLTCAIVSHNMDDVAKLCDRVLVLNQGRVFALGTPAEVFSDEASMHSIGLDVPGTVRMANRLRAQGFALDALPPVPTTRELAHAIRVELASKQAGAIHG